MFQDYLDLIVNKITLEQYQEIANAELLSRRFDVEYQSDAGVLQFDDPGAAVDAALVDGHVEFRYVDRQLHSSRSSTSDPKIIKQIAYGLDHSGASLRAEKCAIVRK